MISVIPWLINETAEVDLRLVLRFHSFGMDAKAEMIHCIYQEIVLSLGSNQIHVSKFQIIPRIAFIDTAPVEVMDVVVAEEADINLKRVYVHFTGNANGGIRKIEFGGVSATVMASASIIELGYRKQTPQVIYWAAIHDLEVMDTRYIIQLLKAGGNRASDIISVIFAKPEHRTYKNVSITTERKVNARRALMDEKCTVIFTTAQALQQFIHFFKQIIVWKEYPLAQIGFMDTTINTSTMQIGEQKEIMSLNQYRAKNQLFHYRSNEANAKQLELKESLVHNVEIHDNGIEVKCQSAITTLKKGMREMSSEEFKSILNEICLSMNLQLKPKEIDNKRAISSVHQIVNENSKGGAAWSGSKHSARLEKLKNQSVQDMELELK